MPEEQHTDDTEILELENPEDSIEEKVKEIPTQVPTDINMDQREIIEDASKANSVDPYIKKIEALLQRFPKLESIEQNDLTNEEYYNRLFRAASNNQLSYVIKNGFNSINIGLEYYLTIFAHIDIRGYADVCKNDPNIEQTLDLIRIKNMAVLENISPEYLLLLYMGTNMLSVYNLNKALKSQGQEPKNSSANGFFSN